MEKWYIWDIRYMDKKTGPYTEVEAKRGAVLLNDFVLRNAGITYNPFKAKREKGTAK